MLRRSETLEWRLLVTLLSHILQASELRSERRADLSSLEGTKANTHLCGYYLVPSWIMLIHPNGLIIFVTVLHFIFYCSNIKPLEFNMLTYLIVVSEMKLYLE